MSQKPPLNYNDVTRTSVPDPDGSIRPTTEQVKEAYDGSRTRAADEAGLSSLVQSALRAHDDAGRVSLEIRNDQVELRGQVTRASSLDEIEQAVRSVSGVGSVSNKLVVGS